MLRIRSLHKKVLTLAIPANAPIRNNRHYAHQSADGCHEQRRESIPTWKPTSAGKFRGFILLNLTHTYVDVQMNLYGPIGTRVSGRGLGRGKHGTTQPGMPSGPQSGNPLGGRPNGLQQSPQPRMPLGLQQPGRLWRNPAIQQQMQNQLGQPPPAMQGMMPNPSPMGQRGMPFGGTATSNPNWANGSGQHPRAGVAPTRRERFQPAAGAGRRQSDVGREGDVIGELRPRAF